MLICFPTETTFYKQDTVGGGNIGDNRGHNVVNMVNLTYNFSRIQIMYTVFFFIWQRYIIYNDYWNKTQVESVQFGKTLDSNLCFRLIR